MIPGISSRLEHELKELYVAKKFKGDVSGLKRVPIKIHDPPSRKNAVFLGASFVANISADN
jgi:actin-related protein 2